MSTPTGTDVRPRTIVLGPLDAAALEVLAAGREVTALAALPSEPWRADHVICIGRVADAADRTAAIDAVARGATVVAEVSDDQLGALRDELRRLGVELHAGGPVPGRRSRNASADPGQWEGLLACLATGASIAEAAERCNLSLRTAHRRLADARATFGVDTNAAALIAWTRRFGVTRA